MTSILRTLTALVALLAFAAPLGATAVQALGQCMHPCAEDGPMEMPAEMPMPGTADCCTAADGPASEVEVVLPQVERPVAVALVVLAVSTPAAPPTAESPPERPPSLTSIRPHLAHSVLLI